MARLGAWFRELVGRRGAPVPDPSAVHVPTTSRPRTPAPRAAAEWDGEYDNAFAVAAYGHLRRRAGNRFFSPFSIRTALCMAYAGARGETAAQMREVLHHWDSDGELHAAGGAIAGRLAAGDGEFEIALANSLWGQDGAALQPQFVDLLRRYHGGEMHVVDFRRAVQAARTEINRWVAERTTRRIQQIVPSGALDVDTRLVLANAAHFKGQWESKFPKSGTRAEPFHLAEGGTVQAQMMRQRAHVEYLRADGYQAVDLEYRGAALAMRVLLPDRQDGLAELEERLSAPMLFDWPREMCPCDVKIDLPRFRLSWEAVDLGDCLSTLGMPLAFSRAGADFSGINGCGPGHEESLSISGVLHSAFVDVNEEGTEAAAATYVGGRTLGMESLAPPPEPVFRADHPFLFAIRERRSGAVLFLGRVTDPTAQG